MEAARSHGRGFFRGSHDRNCSLAEPSTNARSWRNLRLHSGAFLPYRNRPGTGKGSKSEFETETLPGFRRFQTFGATPRLTLGVFVATYLQAVQESR